MALDKNQKNEPKLNPVTPPVTEYKSKPLSWYQDKRFLFGAVVFIIVVWIAATYFA